MSAAIPAVSEQAQASVRRMWPGGPLRRWSAARGAGCTMPLDSGGYGGSYVCDGCRGPVVGLYSVIRGVQRRAMWLCAACKAQPGTHGGQNASGSADATQAVHSDEPDKHPGGWGQNGTDGVA